MATDPSATYHNHLHTIALPRQDMPATRSSSQPSRAQPFRNPSIPRSNRNENATNVLNLNDMAMSSPEPGVSTKVQKKRKPTSKSQQRQPLAIPREIIEISSDDEGNQTTTKPPPATASSPDVELAVIADFRRQISKYREEAAKYKRDLDRTSKEVAALREENNELQMSQKPGKAQITLDSDKLSDHLDCEICTARMWTPYTLPSCGHTFCLTCLRDWFGATQAQYIASHPGYNPNQQLSNQHVIALSNIVQTLAHTPQAANSPHITALLAQVLPAQPQYTCPTCREPVKSRPTEVFALKSLLRTFTTAMGENSPKKSKPLNKAPADQLWDGFFPRKA